MLVITAIFIGASPCSLILASDSAEIYGITKLIPDFYYQRVSTMHPPSVMATFMGAIPSLTTIIPVLLHPFLIYAAKQ